MHNAAENNYNTLHHALAPFLLLAKCFGVLPVCNVWSCSDIMKVHFSWCSIPMLVSTMIICFTACDVVLSAKMFAEQGLKVYTIGSLSFSLVSLLNFALFLRVAREWPAWIKQLYHCELVLKTDCYAARCSMIFSHKIRLWGSLLIMGAIVEHLCYIANSIYNNNLQLITCNLDIDFLQYYFRREHSQIFAIVQYHVWLLPAIQWCTLAMTFVWNFNDIFITMICLGLEIRFKQINWRIMRHRHVHMPDEFWKDIRNDFLNLTDVICHCDACLSGLIVLSCAQNMYYLCSRLFEIFQHRDNFMDELYFWYSLLFVVVRMLTMMFTAAAVYDAANVRIAASLYELTYWNMELKRFNEVVRNDLIALSGKGFFHLTRGLILGMASTVIVYELVLLDQVENYEKPANECPSEMLNKTL